MSSNKDGFDSLARQDYNIKISLKLMFMKIIITNSYRELSEKAANIFLNQLALKPNSVFGLATGSTPLGMYAEIARRAREYTYDFARVITFNLDEYIGLDENHSQSYRYFMQQNFFTQVNIRPKNIFIPDGKNQALKKYCAWYERQINQNPIDLQILGIGQNGHIGFNEPGSGFNSLTRAVNLSPSTIKANARFFNNQSEAPRQAVTVGVSTILKAKKTVMLASGKNKARAVQQMIEGKPNANCPASWLQPHPDATVILDKAAASLLTSKAVKGVKNGGSEIQILNERVTPRGKRILVVSPHHDDSAVSAGATLAALSANNKITIAVMSAGFHAAIDALSRQQKVKTREREALAESRILNSKAIFNYCQFYEHGQKFWRQDLRQLDKLWRRVKPEIIILPERRDEHPTHALSAALVLDYLKQAKIKNIELWFYEGLWSQHLLENINLIFGFDKKLLAVKTKAIAAHRSQTARLPLIGASQALAQFRALTLPEQRFVTFGARPPKLADFVEAYYREKL